MGLGAMSVAVAVSLTACEAPSAPHAISLAPSAVPLASPPPPQASAPPAAATVVHALPGIGACDPTLPKVGAPKARILGVDEVLLAHDRLKPALSACLAKSLHERTTVNLMLGIQPNGSICGATLDTSQLSATTLACLSQTLRRYRFPKADTLTEAVFFPRFIPPSHD